MFTYPHYLAATTVWLIISPLPGLKIRTSHTLRIVFFKARICISSSFVNSANVVCKTTTSNSSPKATKNPRIFSVSFSLNC